MQFIPSPPPGGLGQVIQWLQGLYRQILQSFPSVVSFNEMAPRIRLQGTPSGKSYDITVDDSGTPTLVLTVSSKS